MKSVETTFSKFQTVKIGQMIENGQKWSKTKHYTPYTIHYTLYTIHYTLTLHTMINMICTISTRNELRGMYGRTDGGSE